jgi:hypothetical protein
LIGTSGGVRYFQMGGSLPDKFYNRKGGKPSRDPGSSKGTKGKDSAADLEKKRKKKKRWYQKEGKELTDTTSYFKIGDTVLYGKYKNKKGKVVGFGEDEKGNPTMEIEPMPKGRKKNVTLGLYRMWKAPKKD